MIKVLILLMLLSFCFSYAFVQDTAVKKDLPISNSFVGLEIAYLGFNDTQDLSKDFSLNVKLLFTPKQLNTMFNEHARKYNLELKNYIETKIVTIGGIPYLRSYTSDGYVTTTGLQTKYAPDTQNIILITQGISCTSQQNTQNNGCLPEGEDHCTPCIQGDCTKIVTQKLALSK